MSMLCRIALWDCLGTQSLRAPRIRESGLRNLGNFCPWNPESGKSAMLMEWVILGFEIRNTVQGIQNSVLWIRNPTNDWNRESKFHWQRIQSPVPKIQNPRLAWIAFHGAKHFSHWLLQNCAGNWVKIRPQNSSILQFDDPVYRNL